MQVTETVMVILHGIGVCLFPEHGLLFDGRIWDRVGAVVLVYPDSKIHGANMGPIWGWQDPGEPHVGPMNFAIWVITKDH